MNESTRLRVVFLVGAITDGAAAVVMIFPSLVGGLWGLQDVSAGFRVALGCAASLMLGWTALLVWAYRRPVERRFVAVLTALVIAGLVVTEVLAVRSGLIGMARMAPTWVLQALLFAAFLAAYRQPSTVRP